MKVCITRHAYISYPFFMPLTVLDNERMEDSNAKIRTKIERLEPELRMITIALSRPFFSKTLGFTKVCITYYSRQRL